MLILEKIFKNPRTMKAVFGLDLAKFNELADRMGDEWFKQLENKPERLRAPGAGQPSKIPTGAPNVMGTVMLSVLCGHWRYAHINAVRGDAVNPGLLGVRTVSEDAVRMAMQRIPEAAGLEWLSTQSRRSATS